MRLMGPHLDAPYNIDICRLDEGQREVEDYFPAEVFEEWQQFVSSGAERARTCQRPRHSMSDLEPKRIEPINTDWSEVVQAEKSDQVVYRQIKADSSKATEIFSRVWDDQIFTSNDLPKVNESKFKQSSSNR